MQQRHSYWASHTAAPHNPRRHSQAVHLAAAALPRAAARNRHTNTRTSCINLGHAITHCECTQRQDDANLDSLSRSVHQRSAAQSWLRHSHPQLRQHYICMIQVFSSRTGLAHERMPMHEAPPVTLHAVDRAIARPVTATPCACTLSTVQKLLQAQAPALAQQMSRYRTHRHDAHLVKSMHI